MKTQFLKILVYRKGNIYDEKTNKYINGFKIYSEDLKDITSEKNLEFFNDSSNVILLSDGIDKLREVIIFHEYSFNIYIDEKNLSSDLSEEVKASKKLNDMKDLFAFLKNKKNIIFRELKVYKQAAKGQNDFYLSVYRVFDDNGQDLTSLFQNIKQARIFYKKTTGDLIGERHSIYSLFCDFGIEDKLIIQWKKE
jgi:hypothetical protein